MSRQQAEIMLVRVDTLSAHPKAFQEYVNKHFDIKDICGVNFYYAFLSLNGDQSPYSCDIGHKQKKGIAPSHSCHLGDKVDGEKRLFDWIREKCKDPTSGVICLDQDWDDGCIGSFDYD